ncbi:MFS transporter [Sphingobium sufflavum]|uniref:MFS transporter n=1 Tax=Sphingobium sufflavum TaxID=1129547 RepID=UPI001F3D99AB|nr:MFS transporter [Sphingobium sufflavum]MCE7795333.1 MFS transporter [Sphingobium sufflavum]
MMETRPLRAHARILVSSLVGTAVEYYDFFIYATAAALVFGPLFFPGESAAAQTLLSFMSFGIAFIARPIGAVAFGHFGDRIGRKSTLVVSLLLMGGCTLAIAFLPTYAQVGWIAPALLCTLRFGQGFGLGGEWGGAALLAIENAPKGWEARYGAAPQLGVAVGFCAATGVFLILGGLLSDADFLAWGWRIPFLASAILVLLGLWIRLRIAETPEFRAALDKEPPHAVPFAALMSHHWGLVLAGSAGVVSTYALFYLATAYALAQGTSVGGWPRATFLTIQILANCFYAVGIVLASIHADRTSAARTIAGGSLVTAALGLVFSPALAAGSLPLVTAMLCAAMLTLSFNNAPLGRWLSQLFPVRVRYSGVSLAFNAGGIVGGALLPIAAQGMSAAGVAHYTGLLLTAAGLMTFVGVKLARPAAP